MWSAYSRLFPLWKTRPRIVELKNSWVVRKISFIYFSFHKWENMVQVMYCPEKSMATHSSILAWRIPWMGCRLWGHEESDMTEQLHFHFSLSCTGEGNGNPLQYSCLENPRDGGAWWAAVYGVAQSRTRLTWLSSSSSRMYCQLLKFCTNFLTSSYLILSPMLCQKRKRYAIF